MTNRKIKLLVVDDHAVVRIGLVALFNREQDMTVVGEAENGEQALSAIRKLSPDVVVLDFMMPKMDGAEATAAIHAEFPDVKILILTTFGTSDGIAHALKSGATGAIQKNITSEKLVDAIRRVAAGGSVISPEIKQSLKSEPPIPSLTQKQKLILHSVTRGLSNREIATQFGISTNGVKDHLNAIFTKLGASGRSEAITIALRKHLLKI